MNQFIIIRKPSIRTISYNLYNDTFNFRKIENISLSQQTDITHNIIEASTQTINYIDNIIRSEKLEIDFKKNLILIQNNIIYNNEDFRLKADNVKIDLITNKINISMNNPIKRIEIKKNK